ncbi:divergent polysaccharide deacetylase family protein [Phenylobacterium soli]|uniref:Divergent polysaccharide deacetylase family protein n=2 Tax=Phenylobacterium soli TaxID=2170551 RepID=A0A328AP81_9CAUL|nr:divergent polysaccharide deacetylase family protein [Phenylobacterium soli]
MTSGPPHVREPLYPYLRHAPVGWREALAPAAGSLTVTEDIVRLSERPLSAAAGITWNSGASAKPVAGALPAAPIAGLYAPGPGGPLPIISADGRTPFDGYKRPFVSNGRPKVALVIGGLGLNARATRQAIETLPPEITLSFAPYAEGLQGWIDEARAHGHEVLLETPMEPMDYPDNDPGPYTLMADGSPPEVVKKLEWVLSRATGYYGLTNYLGSRFLASPAAYQAFASATGGRGLGFIDDGSGARLNTGSLPRASAERVIDDQLSQSAIDQQLAALESGAMQRGQALGAGFAYPVTLEKVAKWSASIGERGLQLAPASALAVRR